MDLRHVFVGAVILFSSASAFAVGKTAVITLEFPHGAENCGMGEVGVSLAENVNSVFWNPAALPAIGQYLSVQYVYSQFYESLLPSLGLKDLWHTDTIHAVFLPNLYKNIDFGASYSVNFINMGNNEFTDELGVVIGTAKSCETVRSYAMGLRFYDIASFGFAIKDIDSRLASGFDTIPRNGTAQAQVFDFGIRLEKKFTIAEALDIHPAIGFALHSFPQDSVTYIHNDTLPHSDPLPLKRWYGASIKINFLDLLGFTFAKEREYSVVDQEFIDHQGYKFQITPFFALINGSMVDSSGNRFEEQTGQVVTFNYQQTLNALIRCTNLFNPRLSEKIQSPERWAEKYFMKPNIYLQYATSTIHSTGDNNAREGQKRRELSIGVSLIGDLSALSFKRSPCNSPKSTNVQPAIQKDVGTKATPKNSTSQILPIENIKQDTSNVHSKPVEEEDLVK